MTASLDIDNPMHLRTREDPPLLTGDAQYTDDITPPDAAAVSFLRSDYGHARIIDIDTTGAEANSGVLAVITASALDIPNEVPASTSSLPSDSANRTAVHRELERPVRPLLAHKTVRYQGEPLAMVIAEDKYAAHTAKTRIDVTYEPLDAVVSTRTALEPDASVIHAELSDNIAFKWSYGDLDDIDDRFDDAPHVVEYTVNEQRLIPTPLEPRACLAEYRGTKGTLEVTMPTQNPFRHRRILSRGLGMPEHRIRVIGPAVGGGFGCRSKSHPAEILTAWAAINFNRPMRWQATRSENAVTETHGRGHAMKSRLALDTDGAFLGLDVRTRANVGAYMGWSTPGILNASLASNLSGQYQIPAVYCQVTGVFTNTSIMDSYRGTSRTQATHALEGVIDAGAEQCGFDPIALRRQNFIQSTDFPYQTVTGVTYDSGDYEHALDVVLEMIGYDRLREEQADFRNQSRLRGIGVSCSLDSGGTSRFESSLIRFNPSGTITAYCGTFDHGQGHQTTYANLLGELLGVSAEDIDIVEGDTRIGPVGNGTMASRSMVEGGSSLAKSAEKVVEKGRQIAAHLLESSVEDTQFSNGEYHTTGAPNRSVSLKEVAQYSFSNHSDLPPSIEPGLEVTTYFDAPETWASGTHAAVVEVDVNTGLISLERYAAVDDCGVQINPMIVEGQVVGGTAQGIGQALFEDVQFDPNGTLQTSTLLDYAVPKAHDLPDIEVESIVSPSPFNSIGVKGIGESGAISAPVAVKNAVLDALVPRDITKIDMPMTEEVVWTTINEAQ